MAATDENNIMDVWIDEKTATISRIIHETIRKCQIKWETAIKEHISRAPRSSSAVHLCIWLQKCQPLLVSVNHLQTYRSNGLTWHIECNISQICWICFIHPSGKVHIVNIWKGRLFKSLEDDWTVPLSIIFKVDQSDFAPFADWEASNWWRMTFYTYDCHVPSCDASQCLAKFLPKPVSSKGKTFCSKKKDLSIVLFSS